MPASYQGSTRGAATASASWRKVRAAVLRRDDARCHLCGGPGADAVDHIIPVSQGGSDDLGNLAAIHDRVSPHCHRAKTAQEGVAGRARQRDRLKRPAERHPGLR